MKGISHTLYFKLEVVKKLREYEALQKLGLCLEGAGKATSAHFNGLAESNISKWKAQEEALRKALSHEHRTDQKHYKSTGKLATLFKSKGEPARAARSVPAAAARRRCGEEGRPARHRPLAAHPDEAARAQALRRPRRRLLQGVEALVAELRSPLRHIVAAQEQHEGGAGRGAAAEDPPVACTPAPPAQAQR
mmetsp:Transcript_9557/g.22700  ORF Transcript_9557/g.22700 Transcript_9557/m.22700 type:complete len:192 (+) Transcript_9557:804-1379(+)